MFLSVIATHIGLFGRIRIQYAQYYVPCEHKIRRNLWTPNSLFPMYMKWYLNAKHCSDGKAVGRVLHVRSLAPDEPGGKGLTNESEANN